MRIEQAQGVADQGAVAVTGVPVTEVAEWAGHSVEVLLKVYAKTVEGQGDLSRQRIMEALARGTEQA